MLHTRYCSSAVNFGISVDDVSLRPSLMRAEMLVSPVLVDDVLLLCVLLHEGKGKLIMIENIIQ